MWFLAPHLAALLICLVTPCDQDEVKGETARFESLSGPYFGQELPGSKPELFLPGLISTNDFEVSIAFLDEGRVCVFNRHHGGTFYTYLKDGYWTEPAVAEFADKVGKVQFNAVPDGKRLLLTSSRLLDQDDDTADLNTWIVEWTGDSWVEPYPLRAPANTQHLDEIYASESQDGTLYFFSGWRKDHALGEIYRCIKIDGEYQEAERLPSPLNTEYHELDPYISPDGEFVVFNSNRPGGFSSCDLYISFRESSEWSHPISMEGKINADSSRCLTSTADGKCFLLFSRRPTDAFKGEPVESDVIDRLGEADVYWIGAGFIDKLRSEVIGKACAADLVETAYYDGGVEAAVRLLSRLYREEREQYHFLIPEFMMLCGRVIAAGGFDDAEVLYNALLDTLPERERIEAGFATASILNGEAAKGLGLLREYWQRNPSTKTRFALEPIVSHLNFTKNLADELAVLQFLAEEFPDFYLAHFDLAWAYRRNDRVEPAIASCMRCLQLKPGYGPAEELLEELQEK